MVQNAGIGDMVVQNGSSISCWIYKIWGIRFFKSTWLKYFPLLAELLARLYGAYAVRIKYYEFMKLYQLSRHIEQRRQGSTKMLVSKKYVEDPCERRMVLRIRR